MFVPRSPSGQYQQPCILTQPTSGGSLQIGKDAFPAGPLALQEGSDRSSPSFAGASLSSRQGRPKKAAGDASWCVPEGVAPGEGLGSQGQVSAEAVGGRRGPGAPHPGTTPCPVCLPGPRVSLLHAVPGVGGTGEGDTAPQARAHLPARRSRGREPPPLAAALQVCSVEADGDGRVR